ncbi:MAG: macrolide transporter subunit MacA [Candidatus Methanolliviera sp. GoM_asphalt]|nr:MAG: macrolide transporter subunit MacA [Candidatus Methanolliviera sp. GoM_asphalt]
MKRLAGVVIGVVLLLVVALALYNVLTPKEEEKLEGEIITIEKSTSAKMVNASGNLKMPHYSDLHFTGETTLMMKTVEEVRVDDGDLVKKGDLLAVLDSEDTERASEKTKANYRKELKGKVSPIDATDAYGKVKSKYDVDNNYEDWVREKRFEVYKTSMDLLSASNERIVTMFNPMHYRLDGPITITTALIGWQANRSSATTKADKAHIVAAWEYKEAMEDLEDALAFQRGEKKPRDLRHAEENLKLCEISLEDVKNDLEDTKLIAPFDGIVNRVDIREGDRLDLAKTVMVLVDPSELEVEAVVDEMDALKVKAGQKAVITLDAIPGRRFKGKITSVETMGGIEAGVVTYEVKIEMEDPGMELKDNLTAFVEIIIEEGKEALWVPSEAIEMTEQDPVVSVVVNGEVQKRSVLLGEVSGGMTEILDGALEGEEILVR